MSPVLPPVVIGYQGMDTAIAEFTDERRTSLRYRWARRHQVAAGKKFVDQGPPRPGVFAS
jgi:hypothetical protein